MKRISMLACVSGIGALTPGLPCLGADKEVPWSFAPLYRPAVPKVQKDRESWIRDDLDRFILARLDGAKLTPNTDADRVTLLRRAIFDLSGLPPTEKQIEEFIQPLICRAGSARRTPPASG